MQVLFQNVLQLQRYRTLIGCFFTGAPCIYIMHIATVFVVYFCFFFVGLQCYLPPDRSDIPAFTPADAATRLSDPGGCKAELTWVLLSIVYISLLKALLFASIFFVAAAAWNWCRQSAVELTRIRRRCRSGGRWYWRSHCPAVPHPYSTLLQPDIRCWVNIGHAQILFQY